MVCISLWLVALATSASAFDDPEALAKEALAANPGLEALRARIAELDALASAAGTWSDPVVGIDYQNAPVDSFSLLDHPMSALQLRAQQTLPPWGWSRLRKEVAASRTLASVSRTETTAGPSSTGAGGQKYSVSVSRST